MPSSMHAHLINLAVSETGFVFDPTTGATFTLNPTGLAVLRALRDEAPLDGIVATLRERFHDASGDVQGDVADFLALLRKHGLMPQDGASGARST